MGVAEEKKCANRGLSEYSAAQIHNLAFLTLLIISAPTGNLLSRVIVRYVVTQEINLRVGDGAGDRRLSLEGQRCS